MRRTSLCFAAALLAAPAASHVLYVVPPDEALVDGAPLIVYGEVEHTALVPGEASTDAAVRVDRVLKGFVPGSRVTVRQQGGGGVRVMGLPMLREGDRVLLFLRADRDGVWRTVDMGLGIFFEDRGHVTRHAVAEKGFRHLDRFSRWIEDRAAFGLVRPADYAADEPPGPRVVGQPYTLVRDIASCGLGEKNVRWQQWDPGFSRITARDKYGEFFAEPELSTKVTVTSGPLTDPEAVSMTDAAARLWNGAGGSTVSVPAAMLEEVDTASDWLDPTLVLHAHIGVEYGASMSCDTLVNQRVVREYDGVSRPLFLDSRTHDGAEVAVVFYSTSITDAADPYDSTDTHKCVHWSDPNPNPGNALCPTHNGTYTPQGPVVQFVLATCDSSNVLGYTIVDVRCDYWTADGPDEVGGLRQKWHSALHSIPGGRGQAYRIAFAHLFIADHPLTSAGGAALRAVVAHELGHALGIDHSDVEALMSPVVPATVDGIAGVSLTADDIAAALALYPAPPSGGGAPPSGGGGPPPTEDPPPAEDPVAPPPVPPTAGFDADTVLYDEVEDLWRARSGEAVRFVSTSTGAVASVHWDFGDGTTSRRSTVDHVWLRPGFYDVILTVSGAGSESSVSRTYLVEAGEPRGTCVTGPETICLQDARYEVSVEWRTAGGESGAGRVVHAGTNDSGMFSFFGRDNWEILVKVLNGCSINGHHWVYAASATDLSLDLTVTDTASGEVRRYEVRPGADTAIADPAAFAESCQQG